jgi:hypothetical protein
MSRETYIADAAASSSISAISAAILSLSSESHVRHSCMITRAGVETRDFVVEKHIQMRGYRGNVLDSFNLLLYLIGPHAYCREVQVHVFEPLCISLQSLRSTQLLWTSMCRMRGSTRKAGWSVFRQRFAQWQCRAGKMCMCC